MQTREQLERVAAESAIDLARDGVVYAEVRFAPELHLDGGLTMHEVVRAVLDGFALGTKEAANEGRRIVVRTILSAMRQANLSETIAQLAIDFREEGVCGFDIAGPEDGFPPTKHLRAFHLIQREDFHLTIHAGEAFGLPSIWEAVQFCNAERLGHGVRIVDDIKEVNGEYRLGRLANFVRDRHSPGGVPHLERAHRGREIDRRASHRSPQAPQVSRDPQHRQSAHERNNAERGVRHVCGRLWLDARGHGVADPERRQEHLL
jgi:adenosine deaminase